MSMASDSSAKCTEIDVLLWFSGPGSESLTSQKRIKSQERSGLQRTEISGMLDNICKYSLTSKEDQKLFTVSGDPNPEYIKGRGNLFHSRMY